VLRSPERFCPHCGAALENQSAIATADSADAGKGKSGSGITLVAIVALVLVAGALYLNGSRNQDLDVTVDPDPPESRFVDLEYRLTGSARAADITYTDGSGNIQQQTGLAVPLTKESDGSQGIAFRVERGSFVTFSAQNTGESGDLDCEIRADGRVINRGHASGGYAIVSCSAQVP
jgi:hypothetical protein